jgi:hypothetical protein
MVGVVATSNRKPPLRILICPLIRPWPAGLVPVCRLLGSCQCLRYSRECQVSYVVDIATDRESHYQSNYRSEMPIAAFSSGEASQYSYFSATLKRCCISSGVGGAGGLFGSNGRASSRKKL